MSVYFDIIDIFMSHLAGIMVIISNICVRDLFIFNIGTCVI